MFIVDEEINAVFTKIALRNYVKTKVSEYYGNLNNEIRNVEKSDYEQFIHLTIQKGQQYGLYSERSINCIHTMMYYLGCDFDIDPMFKWARIPILTNSGNKIRDEESSYENLKKVYDNFYTFYTKTVGANNEHIKNSLAKLNEIKFQQFILLKSDSIILDFLSDIYPERFALIANSAWPLVLEKSAFLAMEYGLDPLCGKALMACLIFAQGIGFNHDPLCRAIRPKILATVIIRLQREENAFYQLKAAAQTRLELLLKEEKNCEV